MSITNELYSNNTYFIKDQISFILYINNDEFQIITDFDDKYIITNINNDYYIELKNNLGNYIGVPNNDNIIYNYPIKSDWTRWSKINYNTYKYSNFKFDKNDMELVISRYNEDTSWTFPYKNIVTIYSKGKICNNTKSLKNVGREGHTYLYHIVNNYNNLAKKTIFLKSNNTNESLNLQWLNFTHSCKNINDFINFSLNDNSRTMYFPFFDILTCNYKYSPLDLTEDGNLKHFGKWNIYRENKSGSFIDWFTTYIDNNYNNFKDTFNWSPHGIFTIEKNVILNKSLEYYKNILSTVDYTENPEEGHYLERSWIYIFQKYYIFSYGMSCMNRIDFLKKTLPINLKVISKYPNGILTLLNYNCKQGTHEYILDNYINDKNLNYINDNQSEFFHMSKTKNLTAIYSPNNTDIVSWVDCDNFLNINTIYHNNLVFNIVKNCIITPCTGKDNNWDSGSRIAIKKSDFLKLNGYNENFIGWGNDDIDFKINYLLKLKLKLVYQINTYLTDKYSLSHDENLRIQNYNCYTNDFLEKFCLENNIPKDYYKKIINVYKINSRHVTNLLNGYLSINNVKLYLLSISNNNNKIDMYDLHNNLIYTISINNINRIRFNYNINFFVINNQYFYLPLEFKFNSKVEFFEFEFEI
jgi:hypothetical protein